MAAKVCCKKGYNGKDGYVEFKKHEAYERCPVSNEEYCENCNAKRINEK